MRERDEGQGHAAAWLTRVKARPMRRGRQYFHAQRRHGPVERNATKCDVAYDAVTAGRNVTGSHEELKRAICVPFAAAAF